MVFQARPIGQSILIHKLSIFYAVLIFYKIMQVQEEEEKVESVVESGKDDFEKPVEDLKEKKPNEGD